MTVTVNRLPVRPGFSHGLGRHQEHDEVSRSFEFRSLAPLPTKPVRWAINTPILNQWDTQGCTGNAFAQFLNTDFAAPLRARLKKGWFTERDALQIYSLATHNDGLHDSQSGYYPPDDDGSSGLGAAKACQSLGFIGQYLHTFSFGAFLRALATQPVCMGTAWTNDMENVDANGMVTVGSLDDFNIAGGHEYLAVGLDPDKRLIEFVNSWGYSWGLGGHFFISYDEYEPLLALQGDVVVPQLAVAA